VVSEVGLDQFQVGAADRARNQLQPLGGEHDVDTTSMVRRSGLAYSCAPDMINFILFLRGKNIY
jgi:hypothetical protein